jgi:Tfp pilus assembly protein PilF
MSKTSKRKSKSTKKGFMPKQQLETVPNPKGKAQKTIVLEQINQQINLGIQYCQSGQFPEAETGFQQVLQWQPDNPDAWHLLGVIAAQQKQYSTAIERT